MPKEKIKNNLFITRHQLGLTRQQVITRLKSLGYHVPRTLADYELGNTLPPLRTALALEIVYRKPVAFLWPELYRELREQIRAEEGNSAMPETEAYV
jgi:transcriptional regulator with XRE-family HTH domain